MDNIFQEGKSIDIQEVKEIVPEVVKKQGDGYYSVDYGRLTPVLIDAVKELNAKVDAQSERIDQLLKTIARQNDKLSQMSEIISSKERLSHATN